MSELNTRKSLSVVLKVLLLSVVPREVMLTDASVL